MSTAKKRASQQPALRLAPEDDGTPLPPVTRPPVAGPSADPAQAEENATQRRQADYNESYEMVWNGETLEPFTRARESLLGRLIAADLPSGSLDELAIYLRHIDNVYAEALKTDKKTIRPQLSNIVDLDLYLPTAAKLLYLCSHEPGAWDKDRGNPGRFIRHIEEWTAKNIAPDQVEEACILAQKIRFAHRSQMAVHQPVKGRRADSGN